jgi:hypothetical protein
MAKHPHLVQLQNLEEIESISTLEGDKLKPKPPRNEAFLKSYNTELYLGLVKLGQVFKQNGVKLFTVLSCNVGNDTKFGNMIAKLMQTKTRFYRNLVASAEEPNKQILIWVVDDEKNYDKNRPQQGEKGYEPAFHVVPTYLERKFDPPKSP